MDDLDKHEASVDAVYAEHYNEMRRYRDYEISAPTWYFAILFVFIGFVISSKFDDNISAASVFNVSCTAKFLATLLSTTITTISLYSIRFANIRYQEIRDYVNSLEPQWKTFSPSKRKVTPVHLIYISHGLLLSVLVFLIFYPPVRDGFVAAILSLIVAFGTPFIFLRKTKSK